MAANIGDKILSQANLLKLAQKHNWNYNKVIGVLRQEVEKHNIDITDGDLEGLVMGLFLLNDKEKQLYESTEPHNIDPTPEVIKEVASKYLVDGNIYYDKQSYDDELSPEQINELLQADNPWDAWYELEDEISANSMYYEDDLKSYLYTQIIEDLEKLGYNVATDVEVQDMVYEYVLDEASVDYGTYLDDSFNTFIMLATPHEINLDHTGAPNRDFYNVDISEENIEDMSESFIGFLAQAQGYDMVDVVDALFGEDTKGLLKTSKFVKSLNQEVMNGSYMHATTVLGNLSVNSALNLVSGGQTLVLRPTDVIGLFDPWHGSGGMFEIELEKSIDVPHEYIEHVGATYAKSKGWFYTPQDVYGFSRSIYKNELGVDANIDQELVEESKKQVKLEWKEKLLNLFSDDIKKDITVDGDNTYTLDGRNVYKDFEYKGKRFTIEFIYRYAYVSIDDRPKDYIYTAYIYDRDNSWKYLFSKGVYTHNKLNARDFEKYVGESTSLKGGKALKENYARLEELEAQLEKLYDELDFLQSIEDREDVSDLIEDTVSWINWHQVEIAVVKHRDDKANRFKAEARLAADHWARKGTLDNYVIMCDLLDEVDAGDLTNLDKLIELVKNETSWYSFDKRLSHIEIPNQEYQYDSEGVPYETAQDVNKKVRTLKKELNALKQSIEPKTSDTDLSHKVRDWYTTTYPTDELGNDLDPRTTFSEILDNLAYPGNWGGADVYDLLGGDADSVIRERVFQKLAEITGISYENIYYGWLGESKSREQKAYRKYLNQWKKDHRGQEYKGMKPVSFEEFLDNEYLEFPELYENKQLVVESNADNSIKDLFDSILQILHPNVGIHQLPQVTGYKDWGQQGLRGHRAILKFLLLPEVDENKTKELVLLVDKALTNEYPNAIVNYYNEGAYYDGRYILDVLIPMENKDIKTENKGVSYKDLKKELEDMGFSDSTGRGTWFSKTVDYNYGGKNFFNFFRVDVAMYFSSDDNHINISVVDYGKPSVTQKLGIPEKESFDIYGFKTSDSKILNALKKHNYIKAENTQPKTENKGYVSGKEIVDNMTDEEFEELKRIYFDLWQGKWVTPEGETDDYRGIWMSDFGELFHYRNHGSSAVKAELEPLAWVLHQIFDGRPMKPGIEMNDRVIAPMENKKPKTENKGVEVIDTTVKPWGQTIALVKWNNEYVVALSFDATTNKWGQGIYFQDLDKAQKKFDTYLLESKENIDKDVLDESLLQDLHKDRMSLSKRDRDTLEKYLEQHPNKLLGQVMYSPLEWDLFQDWAKNNLSEATVTIRQGQNYTIDKVGKEYAIWSNNSRTYVATGKKADIDRRFKSLEKLATQDDTVHTPDYMAESKELGASATVIKSFNSQDPMFPRQLLGRLIADIRYFIGNGDGHIKHLWSGDVEQHITDTLYLYNELVKQGEKPGITLKELNDLISEMRKYTSIKE